MVKEGRPKFNPRPGRRLNLGLRLPQENGNRVLFKMALTDYERVLCAISSLILLRGSNKVNFGGY